jgi:hypothetical protein
MAGDYHAAGATRDRRTPFTHAEFRRRVSSTLHMLSVMRVGLVMSDTVVITDTGSECLTQTARQLFVV